MTLAQYLTRQKLTQAEFAALVGISQMAVSRYVCGNRVPNSIIMRRIIEATKGKVQANDFFAAPTIDRAAS